MTLDRMRADWPIVGAAWLITLLATSLLAAGPIYSTAVSSAGLHRVLADAPGPAANIEVGVWNGSGPIADADAAVSAALRETSGSDTRIELSGESTSFALPGAEEGVNPDLTSLAFADGLRAHATLLDGGWPAPGAADQRPVPVTVSEEVAGLLDVAVGDRLAIESRVSDLGTLRVEVAGVYRIDDATDPYWWGDEVLLNGVETRGSYRIIGPLFTARDVVETLFAAPSSVRLTWHAFPDFSGLEVDGIVGLRRSLSGLNGRVEGALPGLQPVTATQLDAMLADSERSLLVSRTGVLLLIVQLAVMAAYAIVLTAGLLVEHRRVQTSLLRSRGAGIRQIAAMSLLEGLLLAVPAVAAAPWLAVLAIRILNVVGPLSSVGLVIEPSVALDAYVAAGAAALGCVLLLVVPAVSAARLFAQEQGGLSRGETRTIGQRMGIDLALLAVTLLGLWQLRLYGSPLTTSVRGTLGLDPLLVAAPAIGLLAGGVLALRIVPLLASLVEDGISRGRDLVTALGAWQVARRPLRYTRAALLLMLAMSMGTFAVSYAATWTRSQEDQAGFQAGADVRLTPRAASVPSWVQGSAYRALDGVRTAMPVRRQNVNLGRASGILQVVALSPEDAGVVPLRGDLAPQGLTAALGPLAQRRPALDLVQLPGQPARLRVRADLQIDELLLNQVDFATGTSTLVSAPPDALDGATPLAASVVVRDADGLLHRFSSERVPLTDGPEEMTIPLGPASDGDEAEGWTAESLSYPLALVSVEVAGYLPGFLFAPEGTMTVQGLQASPNASGDAAWQDVRLGEPDGWEPLFAPGDQQGVELPADQRVEMGMQLSSDNPLAGLRVMNGRPSVVSLLPSGVMDLGDASLPVVVNPVFVSATGTNVGETTSAVLDGEGRTLEVVGTINAFPTTDVTQPVALVDEATLNLLRFRTARQPAVPNEWWLSTDPGTGSQVADAVNRAPLTASSVMSLDDRSRALKTDPVALGIIGALTVGFAVAGLFAVIGLAVSAAVSARERRTEFALLRALGLSAPQLTRWLWLENAALLAISLVAGTALGLLIAWAALPSITVTQRGNAPVPSVIIETPWASIAILEVVSLLALVATVVVLAGILRRIGIGSILRMGED
ncbi:MAG TPA: FtsX-like permease family protein [Candidatus Limnocylindria bacterium]|nr:FtsX-like permease family protein [Candidatus Limnocylindria bacterium]